MPRESLAARRSRALRVLEGLRAAHGKSYCFLDFATPFQLLVAVILSAQCTDAQVNRVTPALFASYPDAAALANARREDLERLVYSTGFYRAKAKNIQATARAILAEHGGEVPRTMEALLTLPGVARKTANVVLVQAFGLTEGVCVDTHVGRLARRLGFSTHADPVKVERDLMATFPPTEWGELPFYLIAHGRAVCDAKRPRCDACPVATLCPKRGVAPAQAPGRGA